MEPITIEERLLLTQAVMALLNDWGMPAKEMLILLAMPQEIKPRTLGRYLDGHTPLPDLPEVLERARFLLRIGEALRTSFPTSPDMRRRWMKQANRRFDQTSPLGVMVQGGEQGMMAVLAQLDCTYAWDMSGSQSSY